MSNTVFIKFVSVQNKVQKGKRNGASVKDKKKAGEKQENYQDPTLSASQVISWYTKSD